MTEQNPASDTGMRSPKVRCDAVSVQYGDVRAVDGVSLNLYRDEVTALIGPSGCGKTSLLRCINRMNDMIANCHMTGRVLLDGEDIYEGAVDVTHIRARVGMVFQKPNPFPKSVYDNVAYGPKIHGLADDRTDLDEIVAESLEKAGLWEEVKDRLDHPGTSLSGGQQQRLCIARAIAVSPEVILMDEPCSALDPIATARVEALIEELKGRYAIAIITHSMQQAARISQKTAFLYSGRLIEHGDTTEIFTAPRESRTRDYITGRFG